MWRVVFIVDESDPNNKEEVKRHDHVGTKPNTWGSGDPHLAEEAFTRAMDRLDENEPAFIPLSKEGPPPGNSSKRKRNLTWDGAAGIAQRPLEVNKFVCEMCHDNYLLHSYLAFADETTDFCTKDDPFLAKVLVDSGMNNFSNQFKITRLVCVMCFQKMHNPEKDGGEPFYRVDVNSNISLTSRWSNAMKNTKRTNLRASKLDYILKKVEQAAIRKNLYVNEFNVKRLREKYFELLEMKGKPATDWVVKLGEECFILYYCVGCDTAPIRANMWLRCTT